MHKQNENVNKHIEAMKSNQREILKLKNTVTELKISLERLNNSLDQTEKRINKLKISFDIFKLEKKKKKKPGGNWESIFEKIMAKTSQI